MTNRKTTRRALVLSLLSLLVCCSMLVGTTFAWFTDSVTSGNNQIVAGNLDVELTHTSASVKEAASVEGNTQLFVDENGKQILWEPGAVVWENLTVSNEGTLALKYKMSVNFANENTVEGYGLSQVLKVAVVEPIAAEATREEVLTAVNGKGGNLASFTEEGLLLPKDSTLTVENAKVYSETYGVVIWWEPSAEDNNWNVNNGKTVSDFAETQKNELHIDLGINLFATQLEAEYDSFGNDYDKDAGWLLGAETDWYNDTDTEFTISTASELAGFAQLVNGGNTFAGKTVKLAENIDLSGATWTPIGNTTFDRAGDGNFVVNAAFKGTFDGQGHTIRNLKINDPSANGVGLFGAAVGATIENVNIENVDIVADGTAGAIVGYVRDYSKTTIINNCHVSGDVSIVTDWAYVGGIAAYGHANISGCSVIPTGTGVLTSANRNAVGGIMGWNYGSYITDSQAKNLNMTGWANIGGIAGYVGAGHEISGCTVENVSMTKTRADGLASIGLASGGWSYNAKSAITVTDNSFKDIELNGTYVPKVSTDILYGSEYGGGTETNFVLDNNTQENITNNLTEYVNP